MLHHSVPSVDKTKCKSLFLPMAKVQYTRGRNIKQLDGLGNRKAEVKGPQW